MDLYDFNLSPQGMVGFCAALMWCLVVARWFLPMSLSIFPNAREVTGEFMWREIILMLLDLLTMWMDKTQYPFLLGLLFLVRRSACTYHAPTTTSPFVVGATFTSLQYGLHSP